MATDGFQKGLYELVEGVWQDLLSDPCAVSSNTIYQRYADNASPPPVDSAMLAAFLAALRDLPRLSATATPILETGIQDTENPRTGDWYTFGDYLTLLQEENDDDEWENAWENFYHVNHPIPREGPGTTRRVYIRLSSILVHGPEVLSKLVDAIAAHPADLFAAKIVAPGGQSRRDHIVVYARTLEGQLRALNVVLDMKPSLFVDSLPLSVERIAPGIGIADEPSRDLDDPRDPDGDGQAQSLNSHGTLMAAIIWRVARGYRAHFCDKASRADRNRILAEEAAHELRACLGDGNTPARYHFLSDVRNEFRRWQVNPLTPHITHDSARPPERRADTRATPMGVNPALAAATEALGMAAATAAPGVAGANKEAQRTPPYRRPYLVRPATRRDRDPERGRKLLKLPHH